MRAGHGYDSHVFSGDGSLVLGGVVFGDCPALKAHSDGDALAHAAIDAILGAAALGDIGSRFPDTDPRWRGADSMELLEKAASEVFAAGYSLASLDVTVVCERPKIRGAADAIRARLAAALRTDASRISVKGKTNEGMDAVGEGRGIAVHAVAALDETPGAAGPRIAVLLPCYNEVATVGKVVDDFRAALPEATVYVYDNNSGDGSGEAAAARGAVVRRVTQQGKGHVVRRMFREIEAEVYVLADADDTYPADEARKLVEPVAAGEADMAIGDRLSSTYAAENKRPCHGFGNVLVRNLINLLWRADVRDVMTGYRAFSRTFVKTCPVLSGGFEIETEMTLHALDKRLSLAEIPVAYRDRPRGSVSKLHTVPDGLRVLRTIFRLFRIYRPFAFFGTLGVALSAVSVAFAAPVFAEYFRTGLVPRFPTLMFAGFVSVAALVSFSLAAMLDAVKKQSDQEFERALANARVPWR